MKRLKSNGGVSRPRQDPVSCLLCRSKKLRCDRQQPCSNCSTRGNTCEFITQAGRQPQERKTPAPAAGSDEVLARLKRLEDEVATLRGKPLLPVHPSQQPSPPAVNLPKDSTDEEHRAAFEWLEGIGTANNSSASDSSTQIPFSVSSIKHVLEESAGLNIGRIVPPENIWLPIKGEAISLLRYYMVNVDYLHPVLDPQAVESLINDVYSRPNIRVWANPAQIALLLSIFASTSYLWRGTKGEETIFTCAKTASQMSAIWTKTALDVLEYSRRVGPGSIQDLQATIIISYLIHNARAHGALNRSLHAIALTMARDLALHLTDSTRKWKAEGDRPFSPIEAEVRRRIWWHLISLDWILAFNGGPQQGIYSFRPVQMMVKYPENTDIRNICYQNSEARDFQATASMAFFRARVEIAKICHDIIDTLPHFPDIDAASYDNIVSLDGKFQDLIAKVPVFFRLDEESRAKSREFDRNYPPVAIQRYLIHIGFHTRRSKLHQPFLLRGSVEPKYAYSRDMCLHSARAVLDASRVLEEEKGNLVCVPARLGTVVHHVFIATVTLVMDLCFNKAEGRDEQRREEVTGAVSMIESLTKDSTPDKSLLQPLMDILAKHKVRLLNRQTAPVTDGQDISAEKIGRCPDGGNFVTNLVPNNPANEAMQSENDLWFNGMLQNYIDVGQSIDVPGWDDLFADLESYQELDAGSNELFWIG